MSVDLESGGGRRRSANVHLVPFIDLLSCMIAFLLSTALWSQARPIDSVRVGGGSGAAHHDPPTPPTPRLTVGPRHYSLEAPGREAVVVEEPSRLRALLAPLVAAGPPDRWPLLDIAATDGVDTSRLVGTLDLARDVGFVNVSLSGATGE
jgi:biopolymer transport protein ExbD